MGLTLVAGNVKIQLVQGDIAEQAVDAILIPTAPSLDGEGEVASWVLQQGGASVASELAALRADAAPVKLSRHVLTSGGSLPAKNILHVVGPVWKDGYNGEFVALERVYLYALERAIADGYTTLAVASIATGGNGFPDDRAAYVIYSTFVRELREKSGSLQEVRIVIKDAAKFDVYATILGEVERTMMG